MDYAEGLLDLFKTGIGAYERIQIGEFETKKRYDAFNNQIYENGVGTNLRQSANNLMPLLLIGGLVVLAVVIIK